VTELLPADATVVRPVEAALEPDLPIVDPHHHLWGLSFAARTGRTWADDDLTYFERQNLRTPRYLLEDVLADTDSGHRIEATVFVQCHAMYNADAGERLAPVGETEFVNGIAAMSASGLYGPTRIAAGIVGFAELRLGAPVREVLDAHVRAGNGRFRGVRQMTAWDADPTILGALSLTPPQLLRDPDFRAGFAQLAPLGLSFDSWLLEPQLDDVVELARAFPDTQIVLNHTGSPLGVGSYAGRRDELFPRWRERMAAIGTCPNIAVKVGGLAMECLGFGTDDPGRSASSVELAELWRPYVESCIELVGVDNCMLESNFPVDGGSCSYATLWNAFKRITAGASADEKADLYSGTARRVYRLP
jgi:predicted TIM-barrel fold metal-dependent hydrolase